MSIELSADVESGLLQEAAARGGTDGTLALATVHPPKVHAPQLRAKVLERTRQAPPDGATLWSLRKLAAVGGEQITWLPTIPRLKTNRGDGGVAF